MPVASTVANGVMSGACTMPGSSTTYTPVGTLSNKQALLLGCYNVPLLGAVTSATRTVAMVKWDGTIDTTTTGFLTGGTEYFTGIASQDGSRFYLGGSSTGVRTLTYGTQSGTAVALTGNFVARGMHIHSDGALYVADATST